MAGMLGDWYRSLGRAQWSMRQGEVEAKNSST